MTNSQSGSVMRNNNAQQKTQTVMTIVKTDGVMRSNAQQETHTANDNGQCG